MKKNYRRIEVADDQKKINLKTTEIYRHPIGLTVSNLTKIRLTGAQYVTGAQYLKNLEIFQILGNFVQF